MTLSSTGEKHKSSRHHRVARHLTIRRGCFFILFYNNSIFVHLNKRRCMQGYPLLRCPHYLRTGSTAYPAPDAHTSVEPALLSTGLVAEGPERCVKHQGVVRAPFRRFLHAEKHKEIRAQSVACTSPRCIRRMRGVWQKRSKSALTKYTWERLLP